MKRDAWVPFWILGTAAVCIVTAYGATDRRHSEMPPALRSATEAAPVAVDPHPPIDLVDELDGLIQARFEDLRGGKFGVSRVMTREPEHRMVFRARGPRETQALERFKQNGWIPAMYVVEPRSPELLRGGVTGPIVTGNERLKLPYADAEIEGLAARAMGAKTPVQGRISGLPMEARPVIASSRKCIECHSDRKVGDALGAVVYSFVPDRFAPLAAK